MKHLKSFNANFLSRGFLILSSFFVASPLQASDAEPLLRLKPKSGWVSEYQDQACSLIREFGEGENKVIVALDRFAPGESFRLILGGNLFKYDGSGTATLQFGPNEAEQNAEFFAGSLGADVPAIVIAKPIRFAPLSEEQKRAIGRNDDPDDATFAIGSDREREITFLRVGAPLQKQVVIEIGRMDRPMAAMSECMDNLMHSWGIDVQKHKNLKRKVKPRSNPGRWITTNDYPREMLTKGLPGLIEFRIDVDESGKPIGCQIQATTRPKAFDDIVCLTLLKRARFEPALDAGGVPIRSYWKSRVMFVTPD